MIYNNHLCLSCTQWLDFKSEYLLKQLIVWIFPPSLGWTSASFQFHGMSSNFHFSTGNFAFMSLVYAQSNQLWVQSCSIQSNQSYLACQMSPKLCFRDQKSYISGKEALLFLDGHKATSTWRCSNYYYFDNLIVKMEVLNLGPKGATLGATHLKLNAKKAVPSNGTVASRWRNLIIGKNIHFHQNRSIYIYILLL